MNFQKLTYYHLHVLGYHSVSRYITTYYFKIRLDGVIRFTLRQPYSRRKYPSLDSRPVVANAGLEDVMLF
jgi:hypothetical protein